MQNRRLAARGIIVKDDGSLLCVRLKKYPGKMTDDGQDYWCTPGGGIDIGEPITDAIRREMIEETGVAPKIGNLLYVQQFKHKDWEHLEFFFHITNTEDYEQIDLQATTHGTIEIAEIGFVDPRDTTVLPVFLTKQDIGADVRKGITQYFNNIP